MPDTDPRPPEPAIGISGPATPEDVAAVVAVLAAAGGGDGDPPPRRVSTWASHAVAMRRPLSPGAGAWRTTYRH